MTAMRFKPAQPPISGRGQAGLDRPCPAVFLCACAALFLLTPALPTDAAGLAEIQQRIVTAEGAPVGGGRLAPGGVAVSLPGMPAPLDPDGVVSLLDFNNSVFSSGALLGDRFVLTAAHSVDGTSTVSSTTVGFQTASGFTQIAIDRVVLHPMYDLSIESGYDIAVIKLAQDAPADAPRYGLYTASDELGKLGVKLGYGRTGYGGTGATTADGQRRVGLNTYDATPALFNSQFGHTMAEHAYLLYDFDSGLAQNDAWGQHGGPADLGFGAYEVNTTSGDSGGPTFIYDGSEWRIAGVTAWGVGLDADPPDVTPSITDASFGEISADSRVSSYATFVQSVVDGTYTVPFKSTFSHGNHRPEQSWQRPNEQGNALAGGAPVTYHAVSFTVDQPGNYDILSQQNFNGVIHLYQGTIDPNNPLVGIIAGSDDGPGGANTSAIPGVTLSPGTTYTLVTSGVDPGEVGTFLNTIDGPGTASATASVGGFQGALAPQQWRFDSPNADARVQADTAPASITLFGGDNFFGGNTDYTSPPAIAPTTVRFNWTYFSEDDPGYDLFSVLIDGQPTLVTTGAELFGTYELTLQPGETFGLRIFTPDAANGPGIVTLDNLQVLGDLDGDGAVGPGDLDLVLAHWSPNTPRPGDIADTNGDGLIGPDDLALILNHWNAGFATDTGPVLNNVPEPGTAVLCLLAIFTIASRARRWHGLAESANAIG